MIVLFRSGIYAAWVVLAIVWIAGASGNKPAARVESNGSRTFHVVLTIIGFVLLFSQKPGRGAAANAIGFVFAFAGSAFCIWARTVLGRNWSATVTLKENHELVRTGPYRFVRHPIYSGALLAMLGTAIAFGGWGGFAGFVIALLAWKRKSLTEEQFMQEQFGEFYARYRREVSSLIPGIL